VARSTTLGTLTLCSRDPGRYGRAELELVQELARRAAIAIDNARLYREAQRAIRIRDDFLVVASHELRTPMTTLGMSLSALDRASRSSDPTAVRTWALRATRQGDRLNRLMMDLLDVFRVEAERLELDRGTIDLAEVVKDVAKRLEPERILASCPISILATPVAGRWDPPRLERVVAGLLSNALKFGAGKPVEISVSGSDGTATLAVQDHGIGIEPAEQSRIFERFERAVSTRHYGGLGLGLYLSRRIVEAHGGTIRVESEPGAGARFTVELPRSPSARRSAASAI
jgi:signal transduction histidine kinase